MNACGGSRHGLPDCPQEKNGAVQGRALRTTGWPDISHSPVEGLGELYNGESFSPQPSHCVFEAATEPWGRGLQRYAEVVLVGDAGYRFRVVQVPLVLKQIRGRGAVAVGVSNASVPSRSCSAIACKMPARVISDGAIAVTVEQATDNALQLLAQGLAHGSSCPLHRSRLRSPDRELP